TVSSQSSSETVSKETKSTTNKDVPTFNLGWSNELHTGNMQLAFLAPEAFKDNAVHFNPITDSQLELVKDGEVIAYVNHVMTKGASECATLMSQGHLDLGFCSSTAMFTTYDKGTDVSILCPIQSGGVSIVAKKDAPYNNFEELVAYAKSSDKPILAGYHSAISSPRIVLEFALKEAGVTVTEDPADYSADVLMMDLKGIANLIPALSSGQVELWAAPVPNPQNAVAQGIGKNIAKLDELPGGKWVDFPCCTMNATQKLIKENPVISAALVSATKDIMEYANTNREEATVALVPFVGMEKELLMQNDTTYTTNPDEKFNSGMKRYYEIMTQMGKFEGRFVGKSFEEVQAMLFDFSLINAAGK
ncbi:MAG: ABC transporter substrate-binding protein, partial [Oscillospiraceae bacterium]